jgi:Xaa-Pro aminopeptidase
MKSKEFERAEYERRWELAQQEMRAAGLDAIIVTSPANYRYYTGHRTSFWSIRDRLRVCMLPQQGEPTIFLTAIEDEWCRACSWITNIVHHSWEGFATWSNRAHGIEELASNLIATGLKSKRIGMELGADQRMGMTYFDVNYLIENLPSTVVDASELLWRLRLIKSQNEIVLLRRSTEILDDAFTEAWSFVGEGVRESDVTQKMTDVMGRLGADAMSFIFVQSDKGENEIPFRDPTDRPLKRGDVLYVDTGSIYRGYKSDYCRMIGIETADDVQREGYAKVYRVLDASLRAVKPGRDIASIVTATDRAMEKEGFQRSKLPIRYGHSIGLEMPEPPSVAAPIGAVKIQPNMVLCLEPGALVGGRYFQLEEMIIVTEDGYEIISDRAPPELPIAA